MRPGRLQPGGRSEQGAQAHALAGRQDDRRRARCARGDVFVTGGGYRMAAFRAHRRCGALGMLGGGTVGRARTACTGRLVGRTRAHAGAWGQMGPVRAAWVHRAARPSERSSVRTHAHGDGCFFGGCKGARAARRGLAAPSAVRGAGHARMGARGARARGVHGACCTSPPPRPAGHGSRPTPARGAPPSTPARRRGMPHAE